MPEEHVDRTDGKEIGQWVDMTYEERSTFGTCPVCGATQGNLCNPYVGIALGWRADGNVGWGGAHLGRLNNAPRRKKTIYSQ